MFVLAIGDTCSAACRDTLTITGTEIREQIFPISSLPKDYQFTFDDSFKEISLKMRDSVSLHALLFPSTDTKGVILYLHGSNGTANIWGKIAPVYTRLGYDFFLLDYRGYGKSEGKVSEEQQVCNDVQTAYDFLKTRYTEKQIIVIGQSIGTGPAAFLAANNRPKMLILQAPYYSIEDWIHQLEPSLHIINNPFKFETYRRLEITVCPIVLIHGNADDGVYYGSSEKLSKFLKAKDKFVTLERERHNDFTKNKEYLKLLAQLLE